MSSPKNTDQNIPIDLNQVMKRLDHDKDFFYELLNIYREEFPAKIQELEKSIAEKKFKLIQEIGHFLKGSSANLGLTYLQEESSKMEQAGKEKDIHKAEKAFKNLNKEFDDLNKYITEEMSD